MRSKDDSAGRTFTDLARRKQFVACAIEVIAEEGFAAASLSKVAQRAGVAKSVVLYHFANKDELVEEVLLHIGMATIEFAKDGIAAATTYRERLRAVIEGIVGFVAANRAYSLAGLEASNRMRSADYRHRLGVDFSTSGHLPLQQLFRDGQLAGEFGEFSPQVMTVLLRQAIDGVVFELAVNPELDVAEFAAELVGAFDRATRIGSA